MSAELRPIAVTGATGKLGSAIIKNLLDVHKVAAKDIIVITRSPEKLADLASKGVQVRKGDFNDAASLKTAFTGAKIALIIPGTDFVKRLEQNTTAIKEAAAAGVKHIIYAGMMSPPKGVTPFPKDHVDTEEVLKGIKGISWSVLGYSFWNEYVPMIYGTALKTGTLYTTSAKAKVAHISEEDAARAAAAALAGKKNGSAKYEITGAEAIDRAQVLEALRKAIGIPNPIKVVEVSEADLRKGLEAAQVPPPFIEMIVGFDKTFGSGALSTVSDGFNKLTGKQPESFEKWAERNKAILASPPHSH